MDQQFPVCSGQKGADTSICSDVDFWEILFYPMIMYCVWQALYILVVSIIGVEPFSSESGGRILRLHPVDCIHVAAKS